jgi:hypothetical protein
MDKTSERFLMGSYVVPPLVGLVGTSYVRSEYTYNGTFVIPYPAGTQTGDLLVMVFHETSATEPTGMTGWTQKHYYETVNGVVKIFTRTADAADNLTLTGTIVSWSIYTFALRGCAWQEVPAVSINTGSQTVQPLTPIANGFRFIVATMSGYDNYARSPLVPELFVDNYFIDNIFFGLIWGVDVILGGESCFTGVPTSSVTLNASMGSSTNTFVRTTHTTFLISTL